MPERVTLGFVAGSARSGTAAWLPRRPEQAPVGSGPKFGSGPAAIGERRQTSNLASRPFRFGSEVEPDPDPPLEPGARIGERHRVVRLLGEGGMGRVYEAEHVVLARNVAIKLLRSDAQASTDSLARFQREALAASRIGAPQIIEVLDFATHVGAGGRAQTYMVMELLLGESLEDWMDRPGTLDEGVALLAELCEGLAAAHRAGVVHRDIKPANVFVRRPSAREATPVRVKILDFGIAKVTAGPGDGGFQTQKGSLLGTPYYLAPERVLGEPLTPAADVYSVGVILYEMLTGDVPFVAESFMGVLARHVQTMPLDPRQAAPERGIPDGVSALCMRLLAKQPDARGSAEQVAYELRSLAGGESRGLAMVRTGPRMGEGTIGQDTQVLSAEPGIHERPTLAPVTSAMMVGPAASWPRVAAAVAADRSPTKRGWIPAVIGVVVALGIGVAIAAGSLLGDRASEVPVEPETIPIAPVIDAAATPIEPTPIEPTPTLDPTPSEPAHEESPVEAGLAPVGEASSASAPEPAPKRPRGTSTKPKTLEPKPDPEPEPEPEPPKPKPIEDHSVPTIKDDIYD
jgi:hypothetical protein